MSDIVPREEIEQIRNAVKYLRTEEAGELAQCICRRCGAYNGYSPRAFLQLFFYLEHMVTEEFITDEKKREQFTENYYYAYLNGGSYKQVIKGAFLVLIQYMEEEKKLIREKMDKPVSMAVQYMRDHYQEQISLDDVSFDVEEGKSILMISSEMEELLGMSDRIVVLHEGRVSGEITKENFSQERVLELASGIVEDQVYG